MDQINNFEESDFNDLLSKLEVIERNNTQIDDTLNTWLNNITSPDYKLINSFTTLLAKNISDETLPKSILKVIR